MKKHFIFAVIFLLLVAPYTISNKIDHVRSAVTEAVVHTINPCLQKTPNTLNNQCNFCQFGFMLLSGILIPWRFIINKIRRSPHRIIPMR